MGLPIWAHDLHEHHTVAWGSPQKEPPRTLDLSLHFQVLLSPTPQSSGTLGPSPSNLVRLTGSWTTLHLLALSFGASERQIRPDSLCPLSLVPVIIQSVYLVLGMELGERECSAVGLGLCLLNTQKDREIDWERENN